MTVYLDEQLMVDSVHPLTVEFLDTNYDPITDYELHNKALLESALALPKQTFGDKDLYPTLEDKTATLFYSLVKNHAFLNGNKRIAVMALLVFLALNHKWIRANVWELVDKTLEVANSKSGDRDEILVGLKKFLKSAIVDLG